MTGKDEPRGDGSRAGTDTGKPGSVEHPCSTLQVPRITRDYFTSNVAITGRWSDGATPLESRVSKTCAAFTFRRLADFE